MTVLCSDWLNYRTLLFKVCLSARADMNAIETRDQFK